MSAIRDVSIGNEPRIPQIDMMVVMNTIAATTIAAASANFQATSFWDFSFFAILFLLLLRQLFEPLEFF